MEHISDFMFEIVGAVSFCILVALLLSMLGTATLTSSSLRRMTDGVRVVETLEEMEENYLDNDVACSDNT